MKEPSSTGKNVYVVGCETEEDWIYIHDALEHDDWQVDDEIPTEHCDCVNNKKVGKTRGDFLLTDAEAEMLSQHPKVEYIHYQTSEYPEKFASDEDEIHFGIDYGQRYEWRYENITFAERGNDTGNNFKQQPNPFQQNKSTYQLMRGISRRDPWMYVHHELDGNPPTDTSNIALRTRFARTNTGNDVDMICVDTGCWIAHPEFMNDIPGVEYPRGYKGGNALDPNGKCAVLDLVLDGPYYLDPDWFNADPENRLEVRWDGTTVPTRSAASSWWSNDENRSSAFQNGDTASIGYHYKRTGVHGDLTTPNSSSYHGTSVASQMYGRTHGWAYNANKWIINTTKMSTDYEDVFDMITIFHETKPINPKYGNKNPTVCNHSWGYVSSELSSSQSNPGVGYGITEGYAFYRPSSWTTTTTGDFWSLDMTNSSWVTASRPTTSSNTKPKWLRHLGYYGYGMKFPTEMRGHAYLTAATNAMNSGAIHVVAPGNSNQKMVFSNHEDYNNHYSIDSDSTESFWANRWTDGNRTFYRSTNRLGYPGQAGRYYDHSSGHYRYKAVIIGALNHYWLTDNGVKKEYKAKYSNMGEIIDAYAPASGTLGATNSTTSGFLRPDIENYIEKYSGGITTSCTSTKNWITAHTSLWNEDRTALIPNVNLDYGLQDSSTWPQVLGDGEDYDSVGPYNDGQRGGRSNTIIWKEKTGHKIVTGGSKNYPTIQHTEIPSSLRGANVGIASTVTNALVSATNGSWQSWAIHLPFDIEYCGIATNKVGVSKYGLIGIGYSAVSQYINPKGMYTTYFNLPYYKSDEYGQIAINVGEVSSYLGIRTDTLGSSPNRQYWIRYASRTGSINYTDGDMDTAWELIFYENDPDRIDIQIDINTHISEATTTISNTQFRDRIFSGTSAASPIACGIIATKLESNRDWSHSDVKDWIYTKVGIQTGDEFYIGSEAAAGTDSKNDTAWDDNLSLHGSVPRVIWNAPTDNDPTIEKNVQIDVGNNLRIDGGGNLNIKYD